MRTLTRGNPRRQLQTRVASFAFARRRAAAIQFAARGLAAGGLLAGLAGVASLMLGLDGGPALTGSLGLVVVLTAFVAGWARQVPEVRVALEIDRRLDLGERVTTALEMARLRPDHPLALSQIDDALTYLSAARPSLVYPPRLSRRVIGLAVAGIALAVAPWVISVPSLVGVRTPSSRVTDVAHAEADRLDDVAKRLEQQKNPADQSIRSELASQLRQAADNLRSDGSSDQQMSRDLLRTQQAAAALAPRTGEDAALTLARISDALNSASATKPVTQALDQQDTAQAAAALNQIANNLATMSPTQRDDLAKALQAASNASRGSDTSAAQDFQQAAQAAKNGDAQGVRQAAQSLQQLGAADQAQRDTAQARSELQSSQQAIADAAQKGVPQPGSTANQASPGAGNQPANQGPGQLPGQGQSDQGSEQGNQQGGGIGKGSADHLGSANNLQGLAQRDVVVPTDQQAQAGSIGASNQLQVGAGGQAQVDYRDVLPQYQKQALQAMEGNAVPTGLKQVVKGYFDSLAAR